MVDLTIPLRWMVLLTNLSWPLWDWRHGSTYQLTWTSLRLKTLFTLPTYLDLFEIEDMVELTIPLRRIVLLTNLPWPLWDWRQGSTYNTSKIDCSTYQLTWTSLRLKTWFNLPYPIRWMVQLTNLPGPLWDWRHGSTYQLTWTSLRLTTWLNLQYI